jgi:hypothetical protein
VKVDSNLKDTKTRLVNTFESFSSADPDWDKATVFSVVFYINPSFDGDVYKGCFAITHQNGDQTFVEYDGSWGWVQPKDGINWTVN